LDVIPKSEEVKTGWSNSIDKSGRRKAMAQKGSFGNNNDDEDDDDELYVDAV
jgi:hypothetical protein